MTMPAPGQPLDTFAPGTTEGNIDRQKALLNDIIATQGQAGRSLYERQPAEAQAALQQQLASAPATPDARKAVFDAYTRDAKLAEQGQTEFMQRQSLLNSNFLDQAKAAVPIHAADLKNQQEALRMQFEDTQNARNAARASAAGSGGGYSKNSLIANDQKQAEYLQYLKDTGKLGNPTEMSLSDLDQLGLAGKPGSPEEIAKKLGISWDAVQADLEDPQDIPQLTAQMNKWMKANKNNVTYADLSAEVAAEAGGLGIPAPAMQLVLAAFASQWGLDPGSAINPKAWGDPYAQQRYQAVGAVSQRPNNQSPVLPTPSTAQRGVFGVGQGNR